MAKPMVLLNALHTTGGGGLIYLNNVLPAVAGDTRFSLAVLVSAAGAKVVRIPLGVRLRVAPAWVRGPLVHVYEQVVLPVLARLWGARAVWCNANYVALFAPRPIPTLHTTIRAGAAWPGLKWRVYWGGLWALTWLGIWRARAVLAVAQHVVQEYPYSGAARKVTVAYPAAPAPVAARKATPHQHTVVAVGDFYAQKNYPLLLDAFAQLHAQLPSAKLVMIGRPVWPHVVQAVQAKITEHGLVGAVEIIPGLPHAELLATLAGACVLVNVSQAECFNMPLLEAMALGVPVVCGDDDFQAEVVADAALTLSLQTGNAAAALAVAMYGMLLNPVLRQKFSAAGQARAAGFTWQTSARVVADVLARVVGAKF